MVDPNGDLAIAVESLFRSRGWKMTMTAGRDRAFATAVSQLPDAVILHGDGGTGEVSHVCQQFKHNPLTAGIPLIVIQDGTLSTGLLEGTPADAFVRTPLEPAELAHHIDVLVAERLDDTDIDDLTTFPRQRPIMAEIERRMVGREHFAAGLLTLREADRHRQDLGRSGIDRLVVLVSAVLRRQANGSAPVSFGYLDNGGFIILGASSSVHQFVARTIRTFETLALPYGDADAFDQHTGSLTSVNLDGAVTLVEPERFDKTIQVGSVLADILAGGRETTQAWVAAHVAHDPPRLVAD